MRDPYSRPVLRALGQMADVTRKTGPNPDVNFNEPGATTSNQPGWLIYLCSPGGPLAGTPFCAYFGF